jgi:hypothetical protein
MEYVIAVTLGLRAARVEQHGRMHGDICGPMRNIVRT